MNEVILKGIIKNIEFSHKIQDIDFYKADIIVKRTNGLEDLIPIKYKKFSNPYNTGDEVLLTGNLRSYSKKDNFKSSVKLFVFSYFDRAELSDTVNSVKIDGNICKKNTIRKTRSDKDVLDFILANNIHIENSNHYLNAYIPIVCWGKIAKEINALPIGTTISIQGELRSREYKKYTSDNDFELRIAHEVLATEYTIIK